MAGKQPADAALSMWLAGRGPWYRPGHDFRGRGQGCHQRATGINVREGQPRAHVGDKGMSAEEIRSILSPAVPDDMRRCATGACLQDGIVDDNCCAPCGHGSCASGRPGEEMRSSTYPDFGSMCGDLFCGHTCCVPPDEWDGEHTFSEVGE